MANTKTKEPNEIVVKLVRFTAAEWEELWQKNGGRKGLSVSNFLRKMCKRPPRKWGGQNKGKRRGSND